MTEQRIKELEAAHAEEMDRLKAQRQREIEDASKKHSQAENEMAGVEHDQ